MVPAPIKANLATELVFFLATGAATMGLAVTIGVAAVVDGEPGEGTGNTGLLLGVVGFFEAVDGGADGGVGDAGGGVGLEGGGVGVTGALPVTADDPAVVNMSVLLLSTSADCALFTATVELPAALIFSVRRAIVSPAVTCAVL